MTSVYDYQLQILYTGGHDGALYGWNFETGTIQYRLHDFDKTCMARAGGHCPIKAQKSIDCLELMTFPYRQEGKEDTERRVLVSGSAD
jgi:hypothetical protein